MSESLILLELVSIVYSLVSKYSAQLFSRALRGVHALYCVRIQELLASFVCYILCASWFLYPQIYYSIRKDRRDR